MPIFGSRRADRPSIWGMSVYAIVPTALRSVPINIVIATEKPVIPQPGRSQIQKTSFDGQVLLQDDSPDGLNFVFRRNLSTNTGKDVYLHRYHRTDCLSVAPPAR